MQLELRDLRKSFGDKEILRGISLVANSGHAFGMLGRNGAGKTTTIRIIMGIFGADSGQVLVDGVPIEKAKKQIKIGYMPEERGLYPKRNIHEQMIYFGRLRGLEAHVAKKRSRYLLEQLDAEEYLDKQLDALSKGNQQKIQLAIAVINDPDIIILDEPLSGLDPVNAVKLKEMIEDLVARGKVVLFSSHQMDYVEEFCRQICIVRSGELVLNGDLDEIKKGYPRDRVLIVPDAGHEDRLKMVGDRLKAVEDRLKSVIGIYVKDIATARRGVVCTLKQENDRHKLMPLLIENGINIEHFEVMEPTLSEIFVEKAGGSQSEGGQSDGAV